MDLDKNKKWKLSAGGKFINKTRLGSQRTLTVTENNTTLLNDNFIKYDRFYLPRTYGLGVSITHNKKTNFAADYTCENWTPLKIGGNGWSLVNSNRFSTGVEIAKFKQQWNQQVEKKYFQFGGFISNSYLMVHNTPINEFGITAGMSGKLNGNLLYTLSVEGGKKGTTKENLIKENFFQFTLGLTYLDFLLSKGEKYE